MAQSTEPAPSLRHIGVESSCKYFCHRLWSSRGKWPCGLISQLSILLGTLKTLMRSTARWLLSYFPATLATPWATLDQLVNRDHQRLGLPLVRLGDTQGSLELLHVVVAGEQRRTWTNTPQCSVVCITDSRVPIFSAAG